MLESTGGVKCVAASWVIERERWKIEKAKTTGKLNDRKTASQATTLQPNKRPN